MKLKDYRFTGLLAGVLSVGLGFFAIAPVHAADEGIGLTISPVSKSYTLDAGATIKDEIDVINTGTSTYTFRVYGKPFFVNDADYTADFSTTRSNADVHKWLKFEKTTYTIAPQETAKIPFTITVPIGAAPGGHYGVIFAQADPPKDSLAGKSGVITSQRLGSLLYATVNGQYRTGGNITSESIPFFQFNPPLVSKVSVRNSGNADFMYKGTMRVKNIFGRIMYTQQNEYRVLADTTRNIQFEWKNPPRFGLYQVTMESDFLDEHKTKQGLVLLVPAWSYLVAILLLAAAVTYFAQHRKHRKKQ